ncbi:MAG: hypothetical protein LBM96_05850 [Methanobrevibacter sp.]|jgi:hypothetical protein|nr:hypothetical protein [Candidatus Methanoflexus mossambicus]
MTKEDLIKEGFYEGCTLFAFFTNKKDESPIIFEGAYLNDDLINGYYNWGTYSIEEIKKVIISE